MMTPPKYGNIARENLIGYDVGHIFLNPPTKEVCFNTACYKWDKAVATMWSILK